MNNLEQNGLSGAGLIVIDTPEMVARYNACLRAFGIPETKLVWFRIDAMGWSPEIAREKGDNDYLSHNLANPLSIILTPKQRHAPIYNPFHSFDWDLMKQVYDTYKVQIEFVTRYEGFCVDIDQDVDQYLHPEDLLLVDEIVVRLSTPSGIMKDAHEQKELVRKFMQDNKSHLDTELINKILGSVDKIGDMRNKPMHIPNMRYTDVSNFYTRALGGWFVLRGQSGEAVLVSKADSISSKGVMSATDKKILEKISGLGLISFETERWVGELSRLEIIRDSFLMDVLSEFHPDMDYVNMDEFHQKAIRHSKEVQEALPEEYYLLDRLIRELRRGQIPDKISKKIRPYLAHPLLGLPTSVSEVVWYLLSMVCDGRSVVRFYRYDKEGFYKEYASWATPKKTWAVAMIRKYYEYRMMVVDNKKST